MSIYLPFEKLSSWQQVAFGSALIERMLPNYLMFAEVTGVDNSKLLRNQLDLVWQWLDKSQKVNINYQAQLTKIEQQIPDPQQFDFFGVFPALDATMAVMSLLQAIQDKDVEGISSVAKLSFNSVSFYVELLIKQEHGIEDVDDKLVYEHPLTQWEKETQNELFDFLKQAPENKNTIKELKALVSAQGVSNLGIEL